MKRFSIFLIALLFVACHEHDDLVPEVPVREPVPSDMEIRFNAEADGTTSMMTRGTLIGGTDAQHPNDEDGDEPWVTPWAQGDEFSTFGLYYFDNMTILGQQYMYDQQVNYISGTSTSVPEWTYSPLKYWPQQGYLDLFAHYPSKEMLGKLRLSGDYTTDPGLTLPDDMQEDDFVAAKRHAPGNMARRAPQGLSSLRFWHENPMDTTISFRYYCLPSGLEAPTETEEPLENDIPVTEYDDARYQPDLMFSHRPHIAKMATSAKVFMNFTHAMMGVRFWVKGIDVELPDDPDAPVPPYTTSEFRNLGGFTINSVTFGPVYSGGECIAYDNTDWAAYYSGLHEATQFSTEPVKLRYVWKYGKDAPGYTARVTNADGKLMSVDYTMAPPYGGCEYRIPWMSNGMRPPVEIDEGYLVETETAIYTQRCDFSLADYSGAYGIFSVDATKSDNGWMPLRSKPILPVLHPERGETAEQSAFIIPPQIFKGGNPYIKITYTLTEAVDGDDIPETLTFTTGAVPINLSDINVEDGEILDIYFTFTIDGDDHFKFIIDTKVNPWQYGGKQEEEWKNW